MKTIGVLAAFVLLLATAQPVAAASPPPADNWLSLINTAQVAPYGMSIIVVPPGYADWSYVDPSWISPDVQQNLEANPGTQAILEAIDYWEWMLGRYTSTHPQLSYVTWTTKILGVDASPLDLANADIIVSTGMVGGPVPFLYHLGLGAPTVPPSGTVFGPPGQYSQMLCSVWLTGTGTDVGVLVPHRLRNLAIHEFGHCIAAGHTGTSVGASHCDSAGTCYTSHPTDVMSVVVGTHRQCLSNLNVQSVAEAYAWLPSPGFWQPHDSETYMLKTDYETTCMPNAMKRY